MEQLQLLPLGVQDFSILREGNYLYVDKTALVYDLSHKNRAVFLSRPRRFGKSLLLSTLRYYFLGRKDLFTGLAIEKLEQNWTKHPVIYFSLASGEFTKENGLSEKLRITLRNFEDEYDLPHEEPTLAIRFSQALKNVSEKTGQKVVVLVDEYDNPLLKNVIVNEEQEEENRALYKAFFSVLKDDDEFLRFYMFTGVTKFSKVSIFSDLNQLNDITLDDDYATICGISQRELETSFSDYIQLLAKENGLSMQETISELKRKYDGYHFTKNMEDMYNPYSLINAFIKKDFGSYWFESGTPTFLINKLKASRIDIRNFTAETKLSESAIKDYRPENIDPTPLFYQSGYLTIKGWNAKQRSYKVGFPNAEVKYGFLNALAPSYLQVEDKLSPFDIDTLDDAVEAGNTDAMRDWFTSLFAILPYPAGSEIESVTEQNFQNVIFMALTMMGKYARTEVYSAKGRADCVLETDDYVYIFEFKRDVSAEKALQQIDEQGYAKPYESDRRKLFKIGVNFDSKERNISEWLVAARS